MHSRLLLLIKPSGIAFRQPVGLISWHPLLCCCAGVLVQVHLIRVQPGSELGIEPDQSGNHRPLSQSLVARPMIGLRNEVRLSGDPSLTWLIDEKAIFPGWQASIIEFGTFEV